ncbi:MAG TPA: two-component regulator propeller domain-containing protein, partial [Verrucomicrobiae bacterium]|nr:two-component regulator propeller domain-containing protein [Verrucomicrobiae bacterium]
RENLRSGPVRKLFGDSRGALWIGSVGGGLIRWQEGRFTTFTMRDKLPAESINALAEDSTGRLWVGTEAGLVVWQDGRFAPLGAAKEIEGKSITALYKDWHGTMWVGVAGAGIYQFMAGKFVLLKDASVEGLLQDSHCLLVDQAGRIWVGAGDDFVLCREGAEWHRYRIPRHLARPYVTALAEEPDGTVWAGSVSEGLFQFKGGKLTPMDARSGLSDNLVESLLVDREGELWVGTDAGLNRLRRKTLTALGQNDEDLGYGAVQGLTEVAPGVIWAGKPSDGLFRQEGRSFNRLTPTGFLRGTPQVNSLLTVRDGSCWVACAHGVLHFKDPKAATCEAEPFALAGLDISSLAEDREGGVWAGSREGGLWRLRDGSWLAQTNPWQRHAITAIVQDTDGSMWIGTEGDGIYRLKTGVEEHLGKEGGGLLSDLIHTLYLDGQHTLWIGTAGGGLSRCRQGHIKTFTTREGLPDDTISQILEDDAGRLWLGSNRGIACVNKSELEEFSAGKIPAIYPQVYGLAEGMLSEECTGGFYPAGLKTKSGLLWFTTLKGIVVADPRTSVVDAPAPTVVIEEVLLDGVPNHEFRGQSPAIAGTGEKIEEQEAGQQSLHIPPGKHRIELRYTGMSFNAPERVRFRYRLEGLDPDWVEPGEAGTRRTASYSYVPPGDYRFHVIACNGDG